MMRMMLGCRGQMMARMMQQPVSPEPGDKHGPAGETGQPPPDSTRGTAGCGCGSMQERMTGKCFEDGPDEEGRRQD